MSPVWSRGVWYWSYSGHLVQIARYLVFGLSRGCSVRVFHSWIVSLGKISMWGMAVSVLVAAHTLLARESTSSSCVPSVAWWILRWTLPSGCSVLSPRSSLCSWGMCLPRSVPCVSAAFRLR